MFKLIIISLLLVSFTPLSYANNTTTKDNKIVTELLSDIKEAQKKLNTSQKSLTKSRNQLATEVRDQERKVAQLREQAAVSQRLQDEKTLSLQQLQSRLKTWSEQHQYQQNILSRFNHNIARTPFSSKTSSKQKLNWLSDYIAHIEDSIFPRWHDEKVVLASGELHPAKVLTIGPVSWYVAQEAQSAGFVSLVEGANAENGSILFKAKLTLAEEEGSSLKELLNTNSGIISLDPTLTRAFKIYGQKETIIDHIGKGGIWIFPIIAFGVFAMIIGLFKAIQFWRLPTLIPAFSERFAQLEKITKNKDKTDAQQTLFTQAKGMQAKLIDIALNSEVGAKRDDRLFASLLNSKHRLDYWLGAIAITAAVSPLLGLLGTVSGMIETFKLMTLFGAGDPAAVSGGISQALVTTELGLVVAIPALLLHALLSRRVKTYYGELESCGVHLSQLTNEK
ncbi:MAG: MotA/TolQ/ExbB proton channel family protein [Colwellia sp.]